ncbi:ribose-phosphate pyrophosphokinase [Pseudoduganella sp. R-32]|uniref:ribose-phosphate pyrophosphokinase n=1 Tax=Pseudoduganella sp. R-32 TaxID=3404061 RepID=UPI003CE9F93A
MTPILFALPGNEAMTAQLSALLGWEQGSLQVRRFPDGESYVRYHSEVKGRQVVLVCTLDRPDDRFMPLYFAASIARDLGAASVGLVAPYLAYMRHDAIFNPGEGITSAHFARLVSGVFHWMVTIDPHLHRHHDLAEIYTIPTRVVRAAPAISQWIAANVPQPLVIGPDSESEQWASEVARGAGCPFIVLEKVRRGDHDVEVSVPDTERWLHHTPVIVDDIASTARTMIAAVGHVRRAGLPPPVCVAVHPLFAGSAYEDLQASGVARTASCDTVPHSSNAIPVASLLAPALAGMTQGAG